MVYAANRLHLCFKLPFAFNWSLQHLHHHKHVVSQLSFVNRSRPFCTELFREASSRSFESPVAESSTTITFIDGIWYCLSPSILEYLPHHNTQYRNSYGKQDCQKFHWFLLIHGVMETDSKSGIPRRETTILIPAVDARNSNNLESLTRVWL